MWRIGTSERQLQALLEELRAAPAASPDMLARIMRHGCTRLWTLNAKGRAHLSRLIEEGAWTDAALALIATELPQWSLRRLVHEDGEWLCSLSRCPSIPLDLDDTADASHEDATLAILGAFFEAQRKTLGETPAMHVGLAESAGGVPLDSENFG